ncbi:UNVERIFIED_CONTAM: hypothetical protein Slati_1517500 [Sesamum latifolium]|uniref:RNase H type-1 domain-containing protein n=1 Tax=Sesamum latifolium TaxID=2727402 RepID=A0AAW2X9I6_9LAMI
MCTDFTNLNKACPKDPYPLPRIDLLVDSTVGYELFSMMDAYQGGDISKTCKQHVQDQIGTTMEVYMDDMLVKSLKGDDHLSDLKQAFEVMRGYGMKLNPNKCTFGVRGGKFLGYMVSERGIEANPEKIEAISKLQSPKTLKEVQKLTETKGGWLLHVDRSSNASNGGADILLQGPDGVEIEVAARLSFAATNNEAEYEALILGLQLALEAGAKELNVCTDSHLVAMQVEGAYETRERTMMQYLAKVKEQMTRFDKCTVQQIP